MRVFTKAEISKMKKQSSWFYGIVREAKDRFVLAEIFPGIGYSVQTRLISFENVKMAVRDLSVQYGESDGVKRKRKRKEGA